MLIVYYHVPPRFEFSFTEITLVVVLRLHVSFLGILNQIPFGTRDIFQRYRYIDSNIKYYVTGL